MFNLATIEDFEKQFPDELAAKKFLWKIRDEYFHFCHKCKCEKLYTQNNGFDKKCSQCKSPITVSAGSIITNTKLTLLEWLRYIYLFAKTKGRHSISSTNKHTFLCAFIADDKIKRIFHLINKDENDTIEYVFIEACKNIFRLNANDLKRNESVKTYQIDPNEIYDLSDPATYNKVLLFATKQMYFALHKMWIFEIFIEPSSLIAETYISIVESDIKSIKGSVLVTALRKTQNRLWTQHINDTPKLQRYIRWYHKEYKKKSVKNISDVYVKDLIRTADRNSGEWIPERTHLELMELIRIKRGKIKENRAKRGESYDIDFNLY